MISLKCFYTLLTRSEFNRFAPLLLLFLIAGCGQAGAAEPVSMDASRPPATADITADSSDSVRNAFVRFRQMAKQGDADARYNLAIFFEEGMGTEPDLTQALYWYDRAASQGHIRAGYKLGMLYLSGPPHIQDMDKALAMLSKAADVGDINALYRLGLVHLDPQQPVYSEHRSIRYFRRAARRGHSLSQQQLGQIFTTSERYQDLVKAYIWLSISARRGNRESIPLIAGVSRRLTDSQREVAGKAISEIYEAVYAGGETRNKAFSSRSIGLSTAILVTTSWLSGQGMSISHAELPDILIEGKEDIVRRALEIESSRGGKADELSVLASWSSYQNVPLTALYDELTRSILMPLNWRPESVSGRAELIHELVHHYQVISGQADRIACIGTLEKHAMRMQNRYLAFHALPPAFSETDIVLMGDCDE